MHVFVVVACGAALHSTPCRIVAVGQHFFLSTGPAGTFPVAGRRIESMQVLCRAGNLAAQKWNPTANPCLLSR